MPYSPTDQSSIQDYLEKLEASDSQDDIWQAHINFIRRHNATEVMYGYDKGFSIDFLASYPDEIIDEFRPVNQHIYQKVKSHYFLTGQPLEFGVDTGLDIFDGDQASENFLKKGALIGWSKIVAFPIPSLDIAVGAGTAVGFEGSFEDYENWKRHHLPTIQQASTHMHNRLQRLLRSQNQLTKREMECLKQLAQGLRPEQIAHALKLKTVTVRLHLSNAKKKIGARTLEETVSQAIFTGILTSTTPVAEQHDK